jgi:uncharacterized membrane protein
VKYKGIAMRQRTKLIINNFQKIFSRFPLFLKKVYAAWQKIYTAIRLNKETR